MSRTIRRGYTDRCKHDRTKVIYGVCVHNAGIRHYCFNRDYKVLPVDLPEPALEAIIRTAALVDDVGVNCFGAEIPESIGDMKDWKTYLVFTAKTAPEGS